MKQKRLVAIMLCGAGLVGGAYFYVASDRVNEANFGRIKEGMMPEEVEKILGRKPDHFENGGTRWATGHTKDGGSRWGTWVSRKGDTITVYLRPPRVCYKFLLRHERESFFDWIGPKLGLSDFFDWMGHRLGLMQKVRE